jgi:hypothetical protein
MSNILEIFNPPKSQPLPDSQQDCVPCLAMSSFVMITGGSFLASGQAFAQGKKELNNNKVSSIWKTSTRFAGFLVVGFGLMRGIEAYRVWESKSGILEATSDPSKSTKSLEPAHSSNSSETKSST